MGSKSIVFNSALLCHINSGEGRGSSGKEKALCFWIPLIFVEILGVFFEFVFFDGGADISHQGLIIVQIMDGV